MHEKRRHHYVPKAYLKAFCDDSGRILVYRKDRYQEPQHVSPDATQFRSYYYSQPTPDGGRDNNALEDFFCSVEKHWPETVARLDRRENVNDRLDNIFQFIALQRARVPAARDVVEAALAQTVKETMMVMLANGDLPPPPPSLNDLPNQVQVAVDPHRSIHAMVALIEGMGALFSKLGLAAVHNKSRLPFLTSDNPVVWFDPSLPFDRQLPYTVAPDGGPICLAFPVSPNLAIIGSTEYQKSFGIHGLRHTETTDQEWVALINTQISRFAYEAVIAQSPGQEEIIAKYAAVSPTYEAVTIPTQSGMLTIHRHVFGPRVKKPKWPKAG